LHFLHTPSPDIKAKLFTLMIYEKTISFF